MEIARKHNLFVIEDGAHSLGAEYKGKKVGTFADMTMFSFHPVKPITTGEGGIIVTNNKEFYEKLQLFRSHGITKTPYAFEQGDWYYEMIDLGFNYRMTDIQAALGLSQLKKIDTFLSRRREIAKIYNEAFVNEPLLQIPEQLNGTNSGWHLYMLQLSEKLNRKKIFNEMRELNIGVHVHYIPVYWHPYYQKLGYSKGLCPIAENWYEHALTLPIHPSLSDDEVFYIIKTLESLIK